MNRFRSKFSVVENSPASDYIIKVSTGLQDTEAVNVCRGSEKASVLAELAQVFGTRSDGTLG